MASDTRGIGEIDVTRRHTVKLLAGAAVTLSGCCEWRGFPEPEIGVEQRSAMASGLLAPTRVNTKGVPTTECIDAHAHFFNASDVTIKGYIEGPVAYSLDEPLRTLVKLLAPLADALGEIAPTAKAEYDSLRQSAADLALAPNERTKRQVDEREKERVEISRRFDELTRTSRGRPFREKYESLLESQSGMRMESRSRIRQLTENSLLEAMQAAESDVDDDRLKAFAATDVAPYAEGILAFIGYMLSSRRFNLKTYQEAFTEKDNTIGVRRTLGAIVNFDRWLDCAPRSAPEDQMKLQLELSRQSGDYMLPVISYNPWTDVAENGRSLALVEEAMRSGFVAAKIYPPNGFRPWGNGGFDGAGSRPDGRKIDAALKAFWRKCYDLDVPVLAHAGPSMGKDAAHNLLSGPAEWQRLLDADFWQQDEAPLISLGHFGGESDAEGNRWTDQFAELMGHKRGRRVFADLGYWEQLQCENVGPEHCEAAKARLRRVLTLPVAGNELVADRTMYGSDWLMLSKEKNWSTYARQLHASLRDVAPDQVKKIFGENAKRCFGSKLKLA